MSDDMQGGGGMVLVPIRWEPGQIDRADALAKATGLPRSVIMRAAFDAGIEHLERTVSALAAPDRYAPAPQ